MYYVEQYRSNTYGGVGNYISDSVSNYIELIKEGNVSSLVIDAASNTGGMTFSDSCVILPTQRLNPESSYYFHGKVKLNASSSQNFHIILLDSTETGDGSSVKKQQYIKSVNFPMGEEVFIDIEFIFQPFTTFDTICFELVRQQVDYSGSPRQPIIIYEELSEIKNLIETRYLGNKNPLKKIGVQTRPNALMSINGEEIRVGMSGIYELREDTIPIKSFSLFSPSYNVLTDSEKDQGMQDVSDLYKNATQSICLFGHEKEREIIPFSLDYVYEE